MQLLSKNNLGDFDKLYKESLTAIHRSGADFIITYGARDIAKIYNQKFYNALNRVEQSVPPIWLNETGGQISFTLPKSKTKIYFRTAL